MKIFEIFQLSEIHVVVYVAIDNYGDYETHVSNQLPSIT